MDKTDYVCFHPYWVTSNGSAVEMEVCEEYFSKHEDYHSKGIYISNIFWGNNSGDKDLTVNNSNDT